MNKNINNDSVLIKGFVDTPVEPGIDLKSEIKRLSREKNAVILAHYYREPQILEIADQEVDSRYLSQQAARTSAEMIVFCGVHFMAETAKILSPSRKVLLPDMNAGCSLADSCKAEDFGPFVKKYPGHTVVSYINTTAEIKALSDIICTSSNAVQIIQSIPEDKPIIFAPDRNLGNYIESLTGRRMIIWNGACHVHEEFSLERILELKRKHPDAKIIAHPECNKPVLIVADYIGSTSSLLKYTIRDDAGTYIVATESGILHQMKKANPLKTFIAAPPMDSTCGCSDCMYMKLNTMKKLYNCLKFEIPEIKVEENLRKRAETSIIRMLEISEKLGL